MKFEPGKTYFGTLSCAHGDFPVVCVRRTDQSVWFTKRGYRDMRCTGTYRPCCGLWGHVALRIQRTDLC
jgi:hypothetical protein